VGVPAGAGEVVIDVVAVASGTKALTPDAPQRLLWEAKRKQRGKKIGAAGSALDTDGATDVTMSWTLRKAKKWAMGAVALKSGAAATPPGTGDATMYYYHNDHLGTPKRLTDVSGTVVWAANYEPFGNVLESVASVSNNLRFPGQYFDQETGLHYNVFRDYDPAIGRYVQSDPIGLIGGTNTYAYALGNPITHVDPTGERSLIGLGLGLSCVALTGISQVSTIKNIADLIERTNQLKRDIEIRRQNCPNTMEGKIETQLEIQQLIRERSNLELNLQAEIVGTSFVVAGALSICLLVAIAL
jgi:RHS repeat-associated protein